MIFNSNGIEDIVICNKHKIPMHYTFNSKTFEIIAKNLS